MQCGLITVIVPIYNTEKYLDRCVESIVNQTYRKLEIILIDDGSTDNSPQMCDQWAEKDERIRVIHQSNVGAGMSRNVGIEAAKGEYICFVDSDDYIDVTMIEAVTLEAQEKNADLVLFGHFVSDINGTTITKDMPCFSEEMYIGRSVRQKFLPCFIYPNSVHSLWSALFSREKIEKAQWKIPSERDVYSEDTYAMIDICGQVDTISVMRRPLYYHCKNGTSLSQSSRMGDYEGIKAFYHKLKELCGKHQYSPEVERKCAFPYLAFIIGAIKYHVASNIGFMHKRNIIASVVEDAEFQKAMEKIHNKELDCKRRLLVWAMKKKKIMICYFLVKIQNIFAR